MPTVTDLVAGGPEWRTGGQRPRAASVWVRRVRVPLPQPASPSRGISAKGRAELTSNRIGVPVRRGRISRASRAQAADHHWPRPPPAPSPRRATRPPRGAHPARPAPHSRNGFARSGGEREGRSGTARPHHDHDDDGRLLVRHADHATVGRRPLDGGDQRPRIGTLVAWFVAWTVKPTAPRLRRAGEALFSIGVSDGTRTRDPQDHNLVLYQLNYTHHRRRAVRHERRRRY